ncbi:MAG: HAMP domain-containing histidine kinase [Proteobacteria bacterium]|nr:HAMP domain-containing histidine kinase [Pseudomonadota bacterium]
MTHNALTSLQGLWLGFLRITLRTFRYSEPNLVSISLLGFVGMPLYYFVWHDLFPQPYENLALRLAGSGLCLILAVKNLWPHGLRRFLPIFWYFTILFALPFFFGFMMLKNGSSPVWLVSAISALLLLILLVDWVNLIVMSAVGSAAAWVAFVLTTNTIGDMQVFYEQLPVFVFALVAGTIFNYRREISKRERLETILAVGSSVAREIRAPLLGIKTGSVSLKQYLPVLLQTFDKAHEADPAATPIPPHHRRALDHVLDRIFEDVGRANTVVDMLMRNSGALPIDPTSFRHHAMAECIESAIERYPFATERQRKLIKVRIEEDFVFFGSEAVMVHVFLTLIKTAFAAVTRAGHGDVTIEVDGRESANVVRFRDTGGVVGAASMFRIFDEFSPLEAGSGTGPGLAFTKRAMEIFSGSIVCRAERGSYTEFTLKFPVAPSQGDNAQRPSAAAAGSVVPVARSARRAN